MPGLKRIDKKTIEDIRTGVDLKSYLESRGIELKKSGQSWMGRCPFHDDTNPSLSVNPSKNLFNCFGCEAGGDVIRFVEMFDQVSFPEAVRRLSGEGPQFVMPVKSPVKSPGKPPAKSSAQSSDRSKGKSKKNSPSDNQANNRPNNQTCSRLSVKDKKLLTRVVSYYQHTLGEDPRGVRYLKDGRGILEGRSLEDFGTGFVNGTLAAILPEDEGVIQSLAKMGILNTKGHETFYNCVVFPLYDGNGDVVNLYGRNIGADAPITHRYLPGPRSGLVNRQAANRSDTIFLTESVIDALTLYDRGFKNVIPVYGVNGLTDDHLFLFNSRIKKVYLVFDSDDPGVRAAQSVQRLLKEKGMEACIITLPDKDANEYFNRHTPASFEHLIRQADPAAPDRSEGADLQKQTLYRETEHGFVTGFGNRQYEIKGIQRGDTRLKVTVKAACDLEKGLFELSTIDLYSSRSRIWFAKLCAALFETGEELIREDMNRIMTLAEDFKPETKKDPVEEITEEERREALRFLTSPDLFDELLEDLRIMGVVGEETNKIVCYLTTVSRKLENPLSTLIRSRSSAGKSTLQNAVLLLVPEEDYEKYTRITDQALFYKEEDSLMHKILAIEEEAGVGGAAYSIRNIQSARQITVAATGKNAADGRMKTETYTVKGPVAVMLTTTAADMDQETASRFIFLSIDESIEMTRAIHKKQREARTLKGLAEKSKTDRIIKKHRTAQRLLRPVAVVNEFTQYLTYPDISLVTRRDHEKYLGLMDAVAYLKQYQREVRTMPAEDGLLEYVEVTLDDIAFANRLADEVLGQSLDELARPSRTLLTSILKMVTEMAEQEIKPIEDVHFNRRMIREYIGWTDWQIRAHIKQLEDMEYLHTRTGSRGKEYSYALNYRGQDKAEEGGKFYLNLTPVEKIREMVKNAESK